MCRSEMIFIISSVMHLESIHLGYERMNVLIVPIYNDENISAILSPENSNPSPTCFHNSNRIRISLSYIDNTSYINNSQIAMYC
jgi:hypothetical protein